MVRTIEYEIGEGEKPGYFYLYRIVRDEQCELRSLVDMRCAREPLEATLFWLKEPGGWMNLLP